MKSSYLLLILGAVCLHCTSPKDQEGKESGTAPAHSDQPVTVQVVTTQMKPLIYQIDASGEIESLHHQPLVLEQSGLVDKLLIRNGSRVASGQVLIQLQNREQQLEEEEAHLEYLKAYHANKAEQLALSDSGYYKDHWQDVKTKTALESGLPQAKVAWDKALYTLEQMQLKAPFTGTISDLQIESGDYVTASDPICTLFDPEHLQITVQLLEYDFPKVHLHQNVEVLTLALPDRTFKGVITEINPQIDASGYFQVRVELNNVHSELIPGMNATVSIQVKSDENHIVVPLESVVHRSGRDVIFTYEEGLAKWNYVTLGLQNGEQIEVLEGLKEDGKVITTNVFQLAHDSPVTLDTSISGDEPSASQSINTSALYVPFFLFSGWLFSNL